VVCCVRPPAGQWSTGAALERGMDSSLLTSVSTDVHTPTGMQDGGYIKYTHTHELRQHYKNILILLIFSYCSTL
jgi:hypothetical protein